MQKRLSDKTSIRFFDVLLNDDFPVSFFNYTQKEKSLKQLHYHNSFEIGICLEGSGMFFIENKAFSFRVGDISFIYPNQPHIAASPNELPSKWIFIDADLDRLFSQETYLIDTIWESKDQIPCIVYPVHCPTLSDIVRIIIEELTAKEANYKSAVRELLSVFIHKISRLMIESKDDIPLQSNAFAAISPSLSYIAQNYPKELFTIELAKICNLSEPHFRMLFKKAIGRSPVQHIAYVRMKMAKTLLKSTNLSISAISQSVGYESISSFNRTFKAQFGDPPSKFRQCPSS